MAEDAAFHDYPVDRTPYLAFGWVVLIAVTVTVLAGIAVWRAGSWSKSRTWFANHQVTGATDALLNGDDALNAAKDAANNAAQNAANDASAAATQKLLEQKDAALKAVQDGVKQAAEAQVQQVASPATSNFQDYLK